jgi:hypothetical protein
MPFLGELSWMRIGIIAVSWPIIWMLILAMPSLIWMREEAGTNPRVAAVGFGFTSRGVALLLLPPLMLLLFKFVIGRIAAS